MKVKVKDKVKSHLSLWSGDVGVVTGIVPIFSIDKENCKKGEWVHVIFPETDTHYGYQQSFDSRDLILVKEASLITYS